MPVRIVSPIPASLLTTVGDLITASAPSTPARLAAVAAGQVLTAQGAGVLPAWAAASAGGGAATSSGTYTGDATTNRAIAHGLGATPKFVFIAAPNTYDAWELFGIAPTILRREQSPTPITVTAMAATNFYVGNGLTSGANANAAVYSWFAVS